MVLIGVSNVRRRSGRGPPSQIGPRRDPAQPVCQRQRHLEGQHLVALLRLRVRRRQQVRRPAGRKRAAPELPKTTFVAIEDQRQPPRSAPGRPGAAIPRHPLERRWPARARTRRPASPRPRRSPPSPPDPAGCASPRGCRAPRREPAGAMPPQSPVPPAQRTARRTVLTTCRPPSKGQNLVPRRDPPPPGAISAALAHGRVPAENARGAALEPPVGHGLHSAARRRFRSCGGSIGTWLFPRIRPGVLPYRKPTVQ